MISTWLIVSRSAATEVAPFKNVSWILQVGCLWEHRRKRCRARNDELAVMSLAERLSYTIRQMNSTDWSNQIERGLVEVTLGNFKLLTWIKLQPDYRIR